MAIQGARTKLENFDMTTATKESRVKILNAALDETPNGEVILRGVLNLDTLDQIKTPNYQREILPMAKISEIIEGFKNGSIPDVDLGMRGDNFSQQGGIVFLLDPVYVIDGLQRITAALHMIQQGGEKKPHLGATIHFSTTEKWERDRFKILNSERTKLSPNILLRNLREENKAVKALYVLTTSGDVEFSMNGRVSWSQYQKRHELLTALTFAKTIGHLHSHLSPGKATNLADLARQLEKMMTVVGKSNFLSNIEEFFRVIDVVWGIQRVAFKEGAIHLRMTFLTTLATLFASYRDFWRGEDNKQFFIEPSLLKKLGSFPIDDPQIANLASQGGKSNEILYLILLKHLNSGKRTKHLKPWVKGEEPELPPDFNSGEE
jgi:hypothetical protein